MYKIGEVAELTGMGIHTLRYYEKLGLLPPPTRYSGIRQYTEGDVRLLKFLYSLKQTGMSLEEMAEFASDGCIIEEIRQKKEEVPAKVKKENFHFNNALGAIKRTAGTIAKSCSANGGEVRNLLRFSRR